MEAVLRILGVESAPRGVATPSASHGVASHRDLRADAYLIVAAGRPLYAATPEELAEIAECALEAGDRIEPPRARDELEWRLLSGRELERFLRALNLPR
jgi:hypothetical protein